MYYFAGIDLGATNMSVVVADDLGEVLGTSHRTTPHGATGIAVTEAVLQTFREACRDATVDPRNVQATGIGSIGPLDMVDGSVVSPANLPDTIDRIPLVGPVRKLTSSDRVFLHNDTTAGVIGERFHADQNPDDMVYLTFSSGIGAGVTVDGEVLHGWDGNVGEVGHFTVDPQGRQSCGCGSDGHWEAYCSGTGIPQYARTIFAEIEDEVTTTLPLGDREFSAADVFKHAEDDPLAARIIADVGHLNAIGVANVVHAYAPIVISIGGAVALNNPTPVLDPIRTHLDGLVMANIPEVKLTSLGEEVVVRGALASALTGGTGDRTRTRR